VPDIDFEKGFRILVPNIFQTWIQPLYLSVYVGEIEDPAFIEEDVALVHLTGPSENFGYYAEIILQEDLNLHTTLKLKQS
ncbi:hypothetical protein Anas_02443, partial [Armadillidium nasatum]